MNINRNLIQRTVTGVLFVGVLVGCILGGFMSFGVLFMLIAVLAVREFCTLVNAQEGVSVNTPICMLAAAALFLCFLYYGLMPGETGIFVPYLVLILYLMVSELYKKKPNPIHNWAYALMSQLYVALPFALLSVLAFSTGAVSTDGELTVTGYNPILPLSIFIFTWINDTGAYCSGMLFGKHRLFERISPKKSWEGFAGGLVVCLLASMLMYRLFPFLPMWAWAGLALTVVVFGTWGDLTESLLKRQLQIKDSGNILPGHGGMLDRFDSSLMAIPAAVVYLYLINISF
jgi:phosphatidate cytidylyltransferase